MAAPECLNPLCEGLTQRSVPEPCTVVIFGATGDLTRRKLIPALYNLEADGDLPPAMAVVGFARRDKDHAQFRNELKEAAGRHSRQPVDDPLWDNFAGSVFYHRSEFADSGGYDRLNAFLGKLDAERGTRGNRLFYLAAGPDQFGQIIGHLREAGLNGSREGSWVRVVVEKPFGSDLSSAHALNETIRTGFDERSTYRIDHYLGKETAQNILVARFANAIFEPLWNYRYIDHVQITASESLGVGSRGGYYDGAGALRDMVQNHLMQLLCLVAMEPPTDLAADSIRDEKVKVIRSLRPLRSPRPATGEDVARYVVRGQYRAGTIAGETVPGYLDEERVAPDSRTETYVALRLLIDNWRWENVPFYLRVGKRLPKSTTEIAVHFKRAPTVLFNRSGQTIGENVLVIRIQPDEGISLRMQAKLPGTAVRVEPVKMDFHYGTSFGKASPEAYERLLLDAMSGDATLFARRDEVEWAWRFVDEIQAIWQSEEAPPLFTYPAGSWGPEAADALMQQDDRTWRRL